MTRAELLALAREALAAQRIAAPLTGRLVEALVVSFTGAPFNPETHAAFDLELLEVLGEIAGHASAANRARELLHGPVMLISEIMPPSLRRRIAAAILAGTERARDVCACPSCVADRAAADAVAEASILRAREAAQRSTG